jgi:NAD-dependent deacetylase
LAEVLLPVSDGRKLKKQLVEHWQVYGELRAGALLAEPNPAHQALADWQRRWGETRNITLITQNVDGLHSAAGAVEVREIHGSLRRTRCTNELCDSEPFEDATVPEVKALADVPICPVCNSPLRLDIILFNEDLPLRIYQSVKQALRDCDLFLAIGTSGTVSPAADFVRSAAYAGARTIHINLTPLKIPNWSFRETILGKAEEILPEFLRS